MITQASPSEGPSEVKGLNNRFRGRVRFWTIIIAISCSLLLVALQITTVATALPSILADLRGGEGDQYSIWAINSLALATTAPQPLVGQLANIFGRRWPMIISVAIFVLGCGLCGGAESLPWFIAGRVVQGLGASGITVLVEVIICDLVPLRRRGKYFAIVLGPVAAGSALGPLFGGLLVEHATWRWIFYMILPIGGTTIALLLWSLHLNYIKDEKLARRLGQIDVAGTVILVGSVTSILLALSWAGHVYTWSSVRVILPLVIGFAGMVGFLIFDNSALVTHPTVPIRLMSNRTSASVLAQTFVHAMIGLWAVYFLPLYFQGVLRSSPSYSGVQLLPFVLVSIPAAGIGGLLLTKLGRYRPIHFTGFSLVVIGLGLFTLLDEQSSTGAWVGFQIIVSAGIGVVLSTLLPALMAPLEESDAALAAGIWSFIRTFGAVWGITIPAAILANRVEQLAAEHISDPAVREVVSSGAYAHATKTSLDLLPEEARREVVWVLVQSLKQAWQVALGFGCLGLLLTLLEKEIPLREDLDTEFGELKADDKERDRSLLGRQNSEC